MLTKDIQNKAASNDYFYWVPYSVTVSGVT